MSVYYNYTGHIIQRPSQTYILEAIPYNPDYPYKCIYRTSGGTWYLYCSTAKFGYYSSTFTATSKQELNTSGEYIRYTYYSPPTDHETASGYWSSTYSGPYTTSPVNTWGTKIWANHTIEDTGLYSNHFYSSTPTYVSGAVEFRLSRPEGRIVLERGETVQLGFSLVGENGKLYDCGNVLYSDVPETQCSVDASNILTVSADATNTGIMFTAKPAKSSGTADLSYTVRVTVGPVVLTRDPAAILTGFQHGSAIRLMRPVPVGYPYTAEAELLVDSVTATAYLGLGGINAESDGSEVHASATAYFGIDGVNAESEMGGIDATAEGTLIETTT